MATIFNIGGTKNGTGFGQITSGTTENKMNNINYDSYFEEDIKLPGRCNQASTTWTNWTGYGSTSLYFSKIAGHVYVHGTLQGGTGTNSGAIGTIPQEYWPAKGVRFLARGTYSGSNGCIAKYLLNVDGALSISSAANSGGSTLNQVTAVVTASHEVNFDYWAVS